LVEAGDLIHEAADLAASHFDGSQPTTTAGRQLRSPLLAPSALADLARLTSAAVTLDQRLPGWWRADESAGGPYADDIADYAADARWAASSVLGDTARQLVTSGGLHDTSPIRTMGLAPRAHRAEWEIRTPGDCAALLHTAIGQLAERPGIMSLAELNAACRVGLVISNIAQHVSLQASITQQTPTLGQRHVVAIVAWQSAFTTLADLEILPITDTATSALFYHVSGGLQRTAASGGRVSVTGDQIIGWYQQIQTMAADLAPLADLARSSLQYLVDHGHLPAPAASAPTLGSITAALRGADNPHPGSRDRLDSAFTQAEAAAATMAPPPPGTATDVQPAHQPLTHLDQLRPPPPHPARQRRTSLADAVRHRTPGRRQERQPEGGPDRPRPRQGQGGPTQHF
jgi:hypothetical protein